MITYYEPPNSSVIKKFRYCTRCGKLAIIFQPHVHNVNIVLSQFPVYVYENVPEYLVEEFRDADYPGKYYTNYIKGKFTQTPCRFLEFDVLCTCRDVVTLPESATPTESANPYENCVNDLLIGFSNFNDPITQKAILTAILKRHHIVSMQQIKSNIEELKKKDIDGHDMYAVGWNGAINTVLDQFYLDQF
jgi:hypothetical protein